MWFNLNDRGNVFNRVGRGLFVRDGLDFNEKRREIFDRFGFGLGDESRRFKFGKKSKK